MPYAVKEIFYTLQGEGAQAGRAAVFCRFAGCNLWTGREQDRASAVCSFCDTDFVGTDGPGGGKFATPGELARAVAAQWPAGAGGKPYVVCTGGEPLLQLDEPLIDAFHREGFEVAVETNGTQPAPAGLSPEERRAYDQITFLYRNVPTQIMMAAHPQTLYGLADSPIALAAWLIDHDVASYGHLVKLFVDGVPYGDLTRDDILDNITLFWLTNTGVSSSRLYREYKGAFFNDFTTSVPAAVSVFPEEVYQAPRSWTERAFTNLVHFNEVPKGGHFAAWEQPALFSEEVRAGFRSLRT